MNENAIVQVWKGWSGFNPHSMMKRVINKGYKTIVSQPWYFDWHDRGPKWIEDYKFNPAQGLTPTEIERGVLGGEAAIWSEFVDASNIFSMVYPRLSAVSERLWSNYIETSSPNQALPRLHSWWCKNRERGFGMSPALYNTNDGQPWLGYCRQPFDPITQDFFYWKNSSHTFFNRDPFSVIYSAATTTTKLLTPSCLLTSSLENKILLHRGLIKANQPIGNLFIGA